MSILETTLIFVVIPVVACLAIGAFSLVAGKNPPQAERYKLGSTWNHSPLLWSATDEVTSAGHDTGHHDTGHHDTGRHAELESGATLIGGRASGKW